MIVAFVTGFFIGGMVGVMTTALIVGGRYDD